MTSDARMLTIGGWFFIGNPFRLAHSIVFSISSVNVCIYICILYIYTFEKVLKCVDSAKEARSKTHASAVSRLSIIARSQGFLSRLPKVKRDC